MEFKKLGEVLAKEEKTSLLTVRATEAFLVRKDEINTLQIVLNGNNEILTSSKERRRHFGISAPDWFSKQLEEFCKPGAAKTVIATIEHPLEVITADVCLILEIGGEDYILSIFRDIPPIGWLIPGGCPSYLEELLNPRLTALRELSEEIVIADTKGRVYVFDFPGIEDIKSYSVWNLKPSEIVPLAVEKVFSKKGDAQILSIEYNGKKYITEDVNVFVDPQTASTTIVLYIRVFLQIGISQLRLFDGEVLDDGALLNRPVRLSTKQGKIAALFHRGLNIFSASWITPATEKAAKI